MAEHGIDPVAPEGVLPYAAVEETIRSTTPLEDQYTVTADDDAISLTVDGALSVSDVTRTSTNEIGS